jgi:tRNA(Ser,Leu) C12 N-acetylase TAN1
MESDINLLVSASWKAPGRSRREIVARLRGLGDEAPRVSRTDRKGIMSVHTNLDPREVVRRLRLVHREAPGVFRYTYRWVPVDEWSAPDMASLRQAVLHLRDRIRPGERWRITVERRTEGGLPVPEIIAELAGLIDGRVDLGHPDKILLIQVFAQNAALAVVTPEETFSVLVREAA